MKIDRMELDDCGSPERLLIAIFKQAPDMPIPVPVEEIASQVGITEIRAVETDGFEGALITNASKSQGAILINRNSRKERKRFTIGHETGHLLVPTHKPIDSEGFKCTLKDFSRERAEESDRAGRMEAEANRFAAGLLMPAKQFREDMRRMRGVDIEHIISIADRYETSKDATARRYAEQHDEPCCVIISKNGRILRVYRPKDFPFLTAFTNQKIPLGSFSAKYSGAKSLSGWADTDASVWLSDDSRIRTISEQVLVQASGFRLTLLTYDETELGEQDEEEFLKSRYTPRF